MSSHADDDPLPHDDLHHQQLPQQRMTGFVIITLPPHDRPDLGKTITAFTISSDAPTSPPDRFPDHADTVDGPPRRTPPMRLPIRGRILGSSDPRSIFGLLGLLLVGAIVLGSFYQDGLVELRKLYGEDDDESGKKETFVFPLFPKYGAKRGDVEFRLGKFVGWNGEEKFLSLVADDRKVSGLVGIKDVADSSSSSSAVFPVRGNVFPDGLYYTYMLVGNPPRRYHLDVDTGSDLTWLQCDAPCRSCGKGANPLYKPKRSKIVMPRESLCKEVQKSEATPYCDTCQQCDYEIAYADHSSSLGVLARDELSLETTNGSMATLNTVFGCGYDQQGLLLNALARTDGILGLSRSRVSLPSQLASLGVINNVIGHCLTESANGGGYLFFGDELLPDSGVTWISMRKMPPSLNFYETGIRRMIYGNSPLSLGGDDSDLGRLIFDSGSSYTYFTKEAYFSLLASLKEVNSSGLVQDVSDPTLPVCWRANSPIRSISEVGNVFKTLTLQFGSKWWILSSKFYIPPEGYLVISDKGHVCLGILDSSGILDGSTNILGDVSLRGKLVVYDNVNQRIGWTQSNCLRPRRKQQNRL
ncbi:hypothetical protein MLD38_026213 [Melastoma candidum]|uniref:Uncharacterized protein n=1 Tax=Melastoma candidum TaxID=119954 RepID=A0ACB9NZG3_9MYRT|nr:hypothetical protein MLD38_026213 [Melastoma candidum]